MNRWSWLAASFVRLLIVEKDRTKLGERNENRIRRDPSKSVMAFLQARMGSKRLPGKVLMLIQGQSILERAIRRLRAASVVDEVAVLTTPLSEDDAIAEESLRLGVRVHRGPEEDVLARFQEASERFRPDVIIRATADNPLMDIGSIDRIVGALCSGCLDLCIENELPYGAATEALTAEALAKTCLLAREPHHREHVTLYIKDRPDEFCSSFLAPPESLRFPQIRLTVDTLEDFNFMNQLIGRLRDEVPPLPLSKYLPLALAILRERECKAPATS
jgi:spore coat polysaccharide biosynthesis protein SpsF